MAGNFFFIVNPNAGSRGGTAELCDALETRFGHGGAEIKLTTARGHAAELAREAVAKNFSAVVVAGGDGTVNETLPALCGTNTALGVIAKGSGNGLARGLGVPLKCSDALAALSTAVPRRMDLGRINGELFANVAGLGIDALIGREFNRFGEKGPRGPLPYYYLGFRELVFFKPLSVTLSCAGRTIRSKPIVLAFANGKQFGGGAVIAPQASMDDGLLHVVAVEHRPWPLMLGYLPSLFRGTLDSLPFVTTIAAKEAEIRTDGEIVYQLDGEARTADSKLKAEIVPGAIFVLAS